MNPPPPLLSTLDQIESSFQWLFQNEQARHKNHKHMTQGKDRSCEESLSFLFVELSKKRKKSSNSLNPFRFQTRLRELVP